MTLEQVSVGNGGWCRWEAAGGEEGYVRVRLIGERLAVSELYFGRDNGITATALRQIPIADIEASVNHETLRSYVISRLDLPGVDLATAASFYAHTFGKHPGHWVGDMLWSQYDPAFFEGTGIEPPKRPTRPRKGRPVEVESLAEPRLTIPTSTPYPDAFYRQVARVYASLAAAHRNPAALIFDANPTIENVTTVHRWVRVCRSKGLLPPAQRGKAG